MRIEDRGYRLTNHNLVTSMQYYVLHLKKNFSQACLIFPVCGRSTCTLMLSVCVVRQAAWRMPGQYLVILRPGTHESHVQRTIKRLRAKAARRGYLLEIPQTYSGALHGFLVKMSSDVLHMVHASPAAVLISEPCGGE